jgi:hypothetical protein
VAIKNRKLLMQKGLKLLRVFSTGDKTERVDHANGYNSIPVQSTGIPRIAERSDKPFIRNRLRVMHVKPLRFLGLKKISLKRCHYGLFDTIIYLICAFSTLITH